jgi:tetratricopeptide (TPR) repeat protein
LAGLTREAAIALLDRAAGIGVLEPIDSGWYQIHPALPWYFATLFIIVYGPPDSPAAQRATRSYARVVGQLGVYFSSEGEAGHVAQVLGLLRGEENNLRQALDLARAFGDWSAVGGCLQSLHTLYDRTGRDSEWARLVRDLTPHFVDVTTGGPMPGREDYWSAFTGYLIDLASAARDWPAALALQGVVTTRDRDRAAAALSAAPDSLLARQRRDIRTLAIGLANLGQVLLEQGDPECLPHFQEAMELFRRIDDHQNEAKLALALGNAYREVPDLRNPDQAEQWYQHALTLRDPADQLGRAICLGSLGSIAVDRFDDSRAAGQPEPILLDHLNTALRHYQQSLDLTPVVDHQTRAVIESHFGGIYHRAGDNRQALLHYQQSIQHKEARDDVYGAGETRFNIAILLGDANRAAEALLYARAALDNFRQTGPGAADKVAIAESLIADLERRI